MYFADLSQRGSVFLYPFLFSFNPRGLGAFLALAAGVLGLTMIRIGRVPYSVKDGLSSSGNTLPPRSVAREHYERHYESLLDRWTPNLEAASDPAVCATAAPAAWAPGTTGGESPGGRGRIGQEVIVSFEEGDPDRPLITGRVYNAEQPVPYELPAEKTKSTIQPAR